MVRMRSLLGDSNVQGLETFCRGWPVEGSSRLILMSGELVGQESDSRRVHLSVTGKSEVWHSECSI